MRVMFRSRSLEIQNFERERFEGMCEELKSQTGNRQITLATMREHQLVAAAVTKLLWSRDRAELETVGQLRLALRDLRQEEEELQPERKNTLTWLEEVPSRRDQGTGNGTEHTNLWIQRQAPGEGGVDSRPAASVRETDRHGNGAVRVVCSRRAGRRDGRVDTVQKELIPGDANWIRRKRTSS